MPEEPPMDQSARECSFAMLSDAGRVRAGNEDFCAASPGHGLFVVCDGMGGAAAGEIASQLAAQTFLAHMEAALPLPHMTASALSTAVRAANTAVYGRAADTPYMRGMGTTLVALMLERLADGERRLWLAHVGDSRCYRLRAGVLTLMTEDHSLVQEQVAAGQMTAEQAECSPMRNIITRAIGSTPRVETEVQQLEPEVGDLYLLGSDGLTRELSEDAVGDHLRGAQGELEPVCQSLIDAANAAGGHDNITVLLVRIQA